MSKAIKVELKVYQELDTIRGKGETFSMVVESLLNTRRYMLNLLGLIEGSLKYDQWKREQLERKVKATWADLPAAKEVQPPDAR